MKKSIVVAGIAAMLALGAAGSASAETAWQAHHPRRVEVNGRLANQDRRIAAERANGEISGREARYLHSEDRAIRGQERFDARFHHGHLTRADQRALNQDENGVSRQIGR